ncbi:MAG: prephenate dehydrogenase/arogenate dehydrogenase family protein [Ghiorsea sp.]|nr:prephenate dehydrogenase/arogenate dehydrogenase family protein [Ghiorsea sp.]MDQ7057705.1 prephenate dehydrogenase/arogenate dehydrogenase family protein [Ghiorsea sp.]
MIQTLAIIGVGLIGGSLALALKEKGAVGKVIGAGRNEDNLKRAKSLGIVDSWTTSLVDAVKDADVVLLAVPMGAYDSVLKSIAPALKKGAIVTDAGSTKQHAIEVARCLPKHISFVAAHPLAGTEKSGADAAFSTLYQNHLCIVTPDETTDKQALAVIEQMWQHVGANVVSMPADEHDKLLGAVSHLPHLAAFSLVNAVNKQKTDDFDPMAYAAGGFKDFTRIASSSPEMWRDIALANRDALEQQIDILMDELQHIRVALQANDKESLTALFSSAKDARDDWLAKREKENT